MGIKEISTIIQHISEYLLEIGNCTGSNAHASAISVNKTQDSEQNQGNSPTSLTNMWSALISPYISISRKKKEMWDPWQNIAKQTNEYINLKAQIHSMLSRNNLTQEAEKNVFRNCLAILI